MNMRPVSTAWFELLTTHEDLTDTLEALAHTGSIQLELHGHAHMQMDVQDLQARLGEYNRLERSYKSIWPDPDPGMSPFSGSSAEILDSALTSLRAWEKEARPKIQQLDFIKGRIVEMDILHRFLSAEGTTGLDYNLLSTDSPVISARLFQLPDTSRLEHIPETILWKEYATAGQKYLLMVGAVADFDALTTELASKKNTYVHIPPLPASRTEALEALNRKQAELRFRKQQLRMELDGMRKKYHLTQALGEIRKLDWFLKHVSSLPVSSNFAWVTGWTSDNTGARLRKALKLQGSQAILHFPGAPKDLEPPLIMQNPWWARPFEIFAGLLGMPDRNEADPSQVLAVLAPLLFGYMFGDVGQGFILLVAGLALKDRWPLLRILVANGASAMIFGLVFGSVFGREDLIPPLWLHPIEDPLPVLAAPLVAAVIIMLTGLTLKALESSWRGNSMRWLLTEAPVIAIYLGIVSVFILQNSFSLVFIVSALTWSILGSLLLSNGKLLPALGALGSLIEATIQLMLNTISFVRVGAFALAHAGLSAAFNIMADNAGSFVLFLLIMLVGNSIVIILEGLVVSIQTTRLILFEFFTRFLQANGRIFKPLAGPSAAGAE